MTERGGLRGEGVFGFVPPNGSQVEPPTNNPDSHLTPDLVNHAIAWIRSQQSVAPGKPFFAYIATGATHAPHHVPKE